MYEMMCTRPDVCLAISLAGRYQSNPGVDHWTEGAYDTSTRGTAQQRPIPMKRPARFTWSKGGGPAHGKPGMFAYRPFTAR